MGISLLIRLVENAFKGRSESPESWVVLTLCLKLITLLSLYKPVFTIVADSFFINNVAEIFIELVNKQDYLPS